MSAETPEATPEVETTKPASIPEPESAESESAESEEQPDPTEGSSPVSEPSEPATDGSTSTETDSSSGQVEDEHRFRLVHQIHNPGNENPHSRIESAAGSAEFVLAELVKAAPIVVKLVPELARFL